MTFGIYYFSAIFYEVFLDINERNLFVILMQYFICLPFLRWAWSSNISEILTQNLQLHFASLKKYNSWFAIAFGRLLSKSEVY